MRSHPAIATDWPRVIIHAVIETGIGGPISWRAATNDDEHYVYAIALREPASLADIHDRRG
jgi:hypothetical protein